MNPREQYRAGALVLSLLVLLITVGASSERNQPDTGTLHLADRFNRCATTASPLLPAPNMRQLNILPDLHSSLSR